MAEEFEIILVSGTVETAHCPQGLAAVETDGPERIGDGEAFEHGGRETRAQPEVAHGI